MSLYELFIAATSFSHRLFIVEVCEGRYNLMFVVLDDDDDDDIVLSKKNSLSTYNSHVQK